MRMKTRMKTMAGLIIGCALVLGACGSDDPSSADPVVDETTETSDPTGTTEAAPSTTEPAPSTTEAAPATTEAAPAPTSVPDEPEVPQAIISLSPTATEMLYSIGAGDQVLAVDDFSNFPSEAAEKMQGLSGFEPNVESIAGLEPDLVITDGTNPDFLGQLDTLGIAHWEGPAAVSFDDVYTQIEQLGAATGHIAEAAELVATMQTEITAVIDGLPQLDEPLTYYHELDPTYFSVTSATFIGAVYREIGLVNIADEVADSSPYPQLNAEFIIDQDPDLIFLACTKYCGETAESVAARPGWESLTAVQNGRVVEMDDDIASRWGPRIVEYLRIAGEAVAAAAPAVVSG